MADAVLTINAGSSSLKFSVYRIAERDQLELSAKGQVEGIGTAPHLVAEDAEGKVLVERRWPDDRGSGHDRVLSRGRRLAARAFRRPGVVARRRSPRRAWRHRVRRAGARLDPPCSPSSRRSAHWRRCISRTISPASARSPRSSPICRRWPASIPRFTAAIPSSPTGSPCRAGSTTRAFAATVSTACPTSTSRACCPRSRRRLPGAASSSPISAAAPACARSRPAAARTAPWASPRWMACPWARAAARSTRASCCI